MAEDSTEEIKVDSPRKPLEPVGDGVSEELRTIYAQLLAEFERINAIHADQLEGVSWNLDKEKKIYTVGEYNAWLSTYKVSRAAYNQRFAGSIETIDVVRAKLDRMQEENEKYEKEHPDVECPDVPEMEDNVVVDNSLAYYLWDGASGQATPTADPGMRALLTRQRTQSISFVVVGEAPRHKKCLPMFVDAAHHSELPDQFSQFDWVSSSDELCEYCEEKGAFAFSLKDEQRYKRRPSPVKAQASISRWETAIISIAILSTGIILKSMMRRGFTKARCPTPAFWIRRKPMQPSAYK